MTNRRCKDMYSGFKLCPDLKIKEKCFRVQRYKEGAFEETLKNGNRSDYWGRWTTCFRKIDGNWLIAHDQVSVPLDVKSGRALLNLEP